jgi:Protein of unknown function (DUF2537)
MRWRYRECMGVRVESGDRRAGDPPLPAELQDALGEWARFSVAVTRGGRPEELELVSRRGRQLASRVADALGRSVEFTDPVTGSVEAIHAGRTGRVVPPAEPTPWATGLAVSAFVAVFAAIADVVLTRAFSDAFGALWLPANLLIAFGVAPSLWMARQVPLWRWIALGAAVGLAAAWVVLLFALLD